MQTETSNYALGSGDPEIARLDLQAATLDSATRLLLRSAGIAPGMRVLDLGTGVGHVATLVADMVGPQGRVIGIDTSERLLEVAASRAAGRPQLQFVHGDVRSWRADQPFDAIVGRLILFHLQDPVGVLRHHAGNLRAEGVLLALDFDLRASRTEPAVPLADEALGWVDAAFRKAGADPAIGARLVRLLADAGLEQVHGFGAQSYLLPHDPLGPALLSGVVRSLAPKIVAAGLATAERIGIDSLEARIAQQLRATGSVVLPPTLVGAWGRAAPAG